MALSNEEVKKIAYLARLGLTDAEVSKFTNQLSSILDYFDALKEVDTDGVEPVAQITGLRSATFADEAKPCDLADKLLEQSPQTVTNHLIKVKSVFEE